MLTELDWAIAYAATKQSNYIDIDSIMNPPNDDSVVSAHIDVQSQENLVVHDTPESLFMKKEIKDIIEIAISTGTCKNLTMEAAQVLRFIFEMPEEFRRYVCAKGGTITRYRLEKFLSSRWKSKSHAKKVMDELEEFTKSL